MNLHAPRLHHADEFHVRLFLNDQPVRTGAAVYLSRGVLETSIEARVPRDSTLVLYCASGNRSALAAVTLQEMGYENVASMAGGFRDWVGTGGDVAD